VWAHNSSEEEEGVSWEFEYSFKSAVQLDSYYEHQDVIILLVLEIKGLSCLPSV
jgi:hypothetical protein